MKPSSLGHHFRHTYAFKLLDIGAPLEFIQGMFVHEKASTTQIYAQLRGERTDNLSSNYIYLRYLEMKDAGSLLDLRLRNRDFYQPFEPIRDESYYTLEGHEREIAFGIQGVANDQAYNFGIFLKETDELVGRIALSGIARGPFQNANLGYFIDEQHNGKGYATAAVSLCLKNAFNEIGLHRVQAGVMPKNFPSIRVLEKAGFRHEGLAKTYLKINGTWEDHELFAITAE